MSTTYEQLVQAYLASELGRNTPASVIGALRRIDPELYRLDSHPSLKRLHGIRGVIQLVHERNGVTEQTSTIPALPRESMRVKSKS